MTKRNPNDGRQPFIGCGGLQLLNAIKLADGQMGLVTVALERIKNPSHHRTTHAFSNNNSIELQQL